MPMHVRETDRGLASRPATHTAPWWAPWATFVLGIWFGMILGIAALIIRAG
jgi:hypothetical protein